MSKIEINPEVDLEVNVADLSTEFRKFATIMYRYSLAKADAEKKRDIAKAKLKEIKAVTRKHIKSTSNEKHTEASLEAEIETDAIVLEVQRRYIDAEHDASTWRGAAESMRDKKDCMIQLGADRRKEN